MRTISLLLLIVYVAGHTGLPLPLPGGASVAGACGCGDTCQCAHETVLAGTCCCSKNASRQTAARSEPTSCCAAKAEPCLNQPKIRSCCSKGARSNECCDGQTPAPLVLLPCGCQQNSPEGIAVCSDPRLLPARIGPPYGHCCGWHAPAGDLKVPARVQTPDDPVPRLTA